MRPNVSAPNKEPSERRSSHVRTSIEWETGQLEDQASCRFCALVANMATHCCLNLGTAVGSSWVAPQDPVVLAGVSMILQASWSSYPRPTVDN